MDPQVTLYKNAVVAFKNKQYGTAKETFEQIHSEGFVYGTYFLARCEIELGDLPRARELLETCAIRIPHAYYFLGNITGNASYYKKGADRNDCPSAYKYGLHLYHTAPRGAGRYLKKAGGRTNEFRGDAFYAMGSLLLKLKKERQIKSAFQYLSVASAEGCLPAVAMLKNVADAADVDEFDTMECRTAFSFFEEGDLSKCTVMLKRLMTDKKLKPSALYTFSMVELCQSSKQVQGAKYLQDAVLLKHPMALSFYEKITTFCF